MDLKAEGRKCGMCSVCCQEIPVREIGNKIGEPCPHIIKGSHGCCGIYNDRPHSCKLYHCAWLLGDVPYEGRPDALGVAFERQEIAYSHQEVLLVMYDVYPCGSLQKLADNNDPFLQWVINHMLKPKHVFVDYNIEGPQPIIVGKPDDARVFLDWMRYTLSQGKVKVNCLDGEEIMRFE